MKRPSDGGRCDNRQFCFRKEPENNKTQLKIYLPGDTKSRCVYVWLDRQTGLACVSGTFKKEKCEKISLINSRMQF